MQARFVGVLFACSIFALSTGFVSTVGPIDQPDKAEQDFYTKQLGHRDAQFIDSTLHAMSADLEQWAAQIKAYPKLQRQEYQHFQETPYHEHLSSSKELGIPLNRVERLTEVNQDSPYYTTGWDGLLAADAIAILDKIGKEFQAELRRSHLPSARFIVTSTYRSAADQAELRQTNGNATKGQSSHEFGGSFDIAYSKFIPVKEGSYAASYEVKGGVPPRLHTSLQEAVITREATWAAEIIAHNATAYDAALCRALLRVAHQGEALVLKEFLQPCYHVTAKKAAART